MDPARMFKESLTSRPELENSQGHKRKWTRLDGRSALLPIADIISPPVKGRSRQMSIFR